MQRIVLIVFLWACTTTVFAQTSTPKAKEEKVDKELLIVGQSEKAHKASTKFTKETAYKIERRITKDGRVVIFRTRRPKAAVKD